MNVLISWAGSESHAAALAVRKWLPDVLPFVDPWVSTEDIRKGTQWTAELWGRVERTSYCIICLTARAVKSPWVNFEAGAIARAVDGPAHVSPLLLGISPQDFGSSPLAMFQCTEFTEDDVQRLVQAINISATAPLSESAVAQRFSQYWVDIDHAIRRISLPSREGLEDLALPPKSLLDEKLHKIEEEIMICVAGDDFETPDFLDITDHVQFDLPRVEYFLENLVKREFLSDQDDSDGGLTYSVTKRGLVYMFENDLFY